MPSLGEGQYRSLNREKQFATRRVLPRFAVGCGSPQSFSYYNASDAHHVKFTYQNDPPPPPPPPIRKICHRNRLSVVASAILGERCKACTFSVWPLWNWKIQNSALRVVINWLPPGHDGRHFADDIFRCILWMKLFFLLIKILLKFVPKGPIDNNPTLEEDNGLGPNRRQALIWTSADRFTDAYMQH